MLNEGMMVDMPAEIIACPPPLPLSLKDRCDRCLQQARVRVLVKAGELLFCSHHYGDNELALAPYALEVRDERQALIDAETRKLVGEV